MFGEVVETECMVHRCFENFRSGNITLENQPCDTPENEVDNNEQETVVKVDTSEAMLKLALSKCIRRSTTNRQGSEAI